MTSIIEKTVAVIAPYRCILCSNYDNIVCKDCIKTLPNFTHPICLLCGKATLEWKPCSNCASVTNLEYLGAYAPYKATLETLIKEYKFNFVRAAAKPLATLLDSCLPQLDDWFVVHVPTAAPRMRWRGYDQARLLAREFARLRKQPFLDNVLMRSHSMRQVGASRQERKKQAESLFIVQQPTRVQDKKIIIVDDVCTTGATLSAAAAVLTKVGAAQVAAVAVAWQPKG